MSYTRRVRLLIFLVLTLFAMGNTVAHMFTEVRPFDWLMFAIEVAIVILILYEIIADA
jgi:hypothetical protein